MTEDDDFKRKKKGKGIFGRKKKKDSSSAYDEPGSANGNEDSPRKKKKKPFGTRIKRLMGGRRRNKKFADDASGISFVDKYDSPKKGPKTSLDPHILAAVMAKEESKRKKRYIDLSEQFPGSPRGQFDDIPEEDEYEMKVPGDEKGDLANPMSLVLLLLDPDTLRFELLQLEFESPQEAKVADVLDQIEGSVTEPAIRTMEFNGLVDRKGRLFKADSPLGKAVTNRRRSRDILVGVSKGMTADLCSRLARPILGDSKVIGMLEMNGYDVRGWAKDKKEESELRDAKMDPLKSTKRKRQLRAATLVLLMVLAMLFYQNFGHMLFGTAGFATAAEVVGEPPILDMADDAPESFESENTVLGDAPIAEA